MPMPFVDASPTPAKVQRFRLILSTYQDGTGQLAAGNHVTLPGWREGEDNLGTLFEWYGESGGQLKYYPLVEKAVWKSDRFQLEPLPSDQDLHYGILSKAAMYYPRLWETCKP